MVVAIRLAVCWVQLVLGTSPHHRSLVADGYTPVPLTPIAGGDRFMVTCRTGGHELKLLLDTGAVVFAAFEADAAKRIGLTAVRTAEAHGFTGVGEAGACHLPELTVGGLPTAGGTAIIKGAPRPDDQAKRAGVALDGVLGHRCLEQYDGVVDYPTRTLYLRPPSQADMPALQGDWACVHFESEGVVAPAERAAVHKLRVTGDAIWIGGWTGKAWTRVQLNARRRPKKLTLFIPYSERKDDLRGLSTGIYRLDGDEFAMCLTTADAAAGVVREFRTFPGSGTQLLKYRRMPKP